MATHSGQVTSTSFSPRGGMQILTAGRDGQLCLLDSRTLESIVKITHPALRIGYNWSRSSFSPDGHFIVAGSLNGNVLIFDNGEGGGRSSLNKTNNAGIGAGGAGGGGGRFGGFGEAFGNAVGNALSKTNLGNTIGNTLGGSIGSQLVNASSSGSDGNGIPNTINNGISGIKCHSILRDHEAAVTSTAWSSGVSGYHQVATVDKLGNLFLWD